MCLGSIAHLQYYFARTGLLEGRGGQLAKQGEGGEYEIPKFALSGSDVLQSPIEEEGQMLWEAAREEGDEIMLPPTVSTYTQKERQIPRPPDQHMLKKDLVEALENALQALESCEQRKDEASEPQTQGFYEIQGLHILDTTTLAIRAARLYYTLHPNASRLAQIKPDYQVRRDLYAVLEVLKKCAARNFADGIREDERLAILVWVSDVGMMIDQEARLEEQERRDREDWHWMNETQWLGRAEERELAFLLFLLQESSATDVPHHGLAARSTLPKSDFATFVRTLADGRRLVQMHNAAVDKSKKRFGHIGFFHQDIAKPYRRADNIRFWLKASESRWELKLSLDVLKLVNATRNDESHIWSEFSRAVLGWSTHVRNEVSKDWAPESQAHKVHVRARSMASTVTSSPKGSPRKTSNVNATILEA